MSDRTREMYDFLLDFGKVVFHGSEECSLVFYSAEGHPCTDSWPHAYTVATGEGENPVEALHDLARQLAVPLQEQDENEDA